MRFAIRGASRYRDDETFGAQISFFSFFTGERVLRRPRTESGAFHFARREYRRYLTSGGGNLFARRYMFGAVAAHKFVIAFCIGVELLALRTKWYMSVIYTCTFAVMSPIGIGIGMLLVGGGSAAASGPMAVILQVENGKIYPLSIFFFFFNTTRAEISARCDD